LGFNKHSLPYGFWFPLLHVYPASAGLPSWRKGATDVSCAWVMLVSITQFSTAVVISLGEEKIHVFWSASKPKKSQKEILWKKQALYKLVLGSK